MVQLGVEGQPVLELPLPVPPIAALQAAQTRVDVSGIAVTIPELRVSRRKLKQAKKYVKETQRYLPAPSTRTDLPPHVKVTAVDVESQDYQVGAGPIVAGTSSQYVGLHNASPIPTPPVIVSQRRTISKQEWTTYEAVEAQWDTMKIVKRSDLLPGDLVAVRVSVTYCVTFHCIVLLDCTRSVA